MNEPEQTSSSPPWGSTTKLIAGITFMASFAAAVLYFRSIIGPLILAFMLAYLLHPVAAGISRGTRLNWRWAVNLIYLVLLLVLAGSFTAAGIAIGQQAQSLIGFVERFVSDLPEQVSQLTSQAYTIGPFHLDFSQIDIQAMLQQLLGMVQSILGQAGTIVSKLATSAAGTVAWALFIMLVSYFLLSESGQLRQNLVRIEIPGYQSDVEQLARKLSKVWDSFLRGQLFISMLVVVSYYILLNILGTNLPLVIAIMAGLARFIPYLGPLVTWTTTVIVVSLQAGNHFGLQSFHYVILVLGLCFLLDQIFDNLVSPRVIGQSLGLHPAGVLIAAIVAANLLGIIGLVLAAPVLATVALVSRYALRKMLDLDPWPPEEEKPPPEPHAMEKLLRRAGRRLQAWWRLIRQKK